MSVVKNSDPSAISVLIPCFNDGEHLRRCLMSIAAQSYRAHEIIVIDDGSTDGTAQVCRDFDRQHEVSFKYYKQSNSGVSSARNKGLDVCDGNYCVFVDADDELQPDALENYSKAITQHQSAQWFIALSQWERNGIVKTRSIKLPASKAGRFRQLLDKSLHLGNISNMCFARSAFRDIQFPEDMRFGEDTVVFAAMLAEFEPVIVEHVAALAHRRDDSLRSKASLEDLTQSNLHDHIFNNPKLTSEFLAFQDICWASNCRSICRRAYSEKAYEISIDWYICMVATKPSYLFNGKMLWRFLKAKQKVNNNRRRPQIAPRQLTEKDPQK